MSDMAILQLIGIVAWLIFAISSYASYRMSWGKTIQMALTWIAIFGGGFLVASLFVGG